MAGIFGPDLRVQPQPQAYTRLGERLYLFQNLDGSGFSAELPVDEDGIVLDYPALFRRVTHWTGKRTRVAVLLRGLSPRLSLWRTKTRFAGQTGQIVRSDK
jgi:hypothetical protein